MHPSMVRPLCSVLSSVWYVELCQLRVGLLETRAAIHGDGKDEEDEGTCAGSKVGVGTGLGVGQRQALAKEKNDETEDQE